MEERRLSPRVRGASGCDNAAMVTNVSVRLRPPTGAAGRSSLLVWGAPLAAVLAGMAAEWLDFRELRVPLLFMVGFGVLATTLALNGGGRGWRAFFLGAVLGFATWAGAETVYAVIHVASGERFDAERFGPQWSQAILLVLAHGLFLGVPTGAVAGVLLQWPRLAGEPAADG